MKYNHYIFRFYFILTFLLMGNTIFAQKQNLLNPIAKKHLTVEQIEALSTSEIIAVNYMFTSSFIVDTSSILYKKWLSDNGEIDITMLNHRRKQYERVYIKNEKYPGFVIELLSKDEVETQINKILNSTENKNQ